MISNDFYLKIYYTYLLHISYIYVNEKQIFYLSKIEIELKRIFLIFSPTTESKKQNNFDSAILIIILLYIQIYIYMLQMYDIL